MASGIHGLNLSQALINIKKFPWVWAITAAVVGINAVGLHAAGISISPPSLAVAVGIVGLMALLSAIYTHLRPDERLAALTGNAAQLLGYSINIGIFSCLVTTLDFPLIDAKLDATDHAIGFDWPTAYAWVWSHKVAANILIWAYNSVIPQIGILVMFFVSKRLYGRARLLIWLYIASSLTYILIAGVLPAAGAFGYYKTDLATPYVVQYYALREGSMKVFDLFKAQGAVQFPSFHMALAVLCTYVTRGMPRLFPIMCILNALVIVATPVIGGHFVTDLWTSAILIFPLIFLVERGMKVYDAKIWN
jgi:hypothetical protein